MYVHFLYICFNLIYREYEQIVTDVINFNKNKINMKNHEKYFKVQD